MDSFNPTRVLLKLDRGWLALNERDELQSHKGSAETLAGSSWA